MPCASFVRTKDFSVVELIRIKMPCEPGGKSEVCRRDLAKVNESREVPY